MCSRVPQDHRRSVARHQYRENGIVGVNLGLSQNFLRKNGDSVCTVPGNPPVGQELKEADHDPGT